MGGKGQKKTAGTLIGWKSRQRERWDDAVGCKKERELVMNGRGGGKTLRGRKIKDVFRYVVFHM